MRSRSGRAAVNIASKWPKSCMRSISASPTRTMRSPSWSSIGGRSSRARRPASWGAARAAARARAIARCVMVRPRRLGRGMVVRPGGRAGAPCTLSDRPATIQPEGGPSMPRLTDTTPEAERVLAEVYRRMTPERKWRLLGRTSRQGPRCCTSRACGAGSRGRPRRAIRDDWIAEQLRADPAPCSREAVDRGHCRSNNRVAPGRGRRLRVDWGCSYALGGSMASTLHGIARQTATPTSPSSRSRAGRPNSPAASATTTTSSEDAIRRAIRDRSCFNVINTTTGFKVDVFIKKDGPSIVRSWHGDPGRRRCPDPGGAVDPGRLGRGCRPAEAGMVSARRRGVRSAVGRRPRRAPRRRGTGSTRPTSTAGRPSWACSTCWGRPGARSSS